MAQGGYKGQPPSMVQEFNDMVSDGISVMVTDKETDQVVGIRISYTQTRYIGIILQYVILLSSHRITLQEWFLCLRSNLGSNTFPTLEQRLRIHPPQYAKTLHLLDTSLCLPDLFKAHPDIDKICYFYALATLPGYRGRGIAKQLVKYAFEVRVLKLISYTQHYY